MLLSLLFFYLLNVFLPTQAIIINIIFFILNEHLFILKQKYLNSYYKCYSLDFPGRGRGEKYQINQPPAGICSNQIHIYIYKYNQTCRHRQLQKNY